MDQRLSWKENLLHALLAFRLPVRLFLSEKALSRTSPLGREESLNLVQIYAVRFDAGFKYIPWIETGTVAVKIKGQDGREFWKRICKADPREARRLIKDIEKATHDRVRHEKTRLLDLLLGIERSAVSRLFSTRRYIRGSEIRRWQLDIQKSTPLQKLELLSTTVRHPILRLEESEILAHERRHNKVKKLLSPSSDSWQKYNDLVIERERKSYSDFFQNVESSQLTDNQVKAALVFDDANLTIAAAGSGKTSVIVAKIGYALASGLFKPHEILALAYNRGAREELENRIPEKLSEALGKTVKIDARTFHSIGLSLLPRRSDGKKWKAYKLDGKVGGGLFNSAYNQLVKDNQLFRQSLLEWVLYADYPDPVMDAAPGTLEDHERRYTDICLKQIGLKRDKKLPRYAAPIPTLKPGVNVRSLQEARIFNWLYLRGIEFEYEKPDFDQLAKALGLSLSEKGYQIPYCPDFTYRIGGREDILVYHEHFGLDAKGKAPAFLGGKLYEDQAEKKRAMFKRVFQEKADFHFFETRSADFYDGAIFKKLEKALTVRGIEVGPPDQELLDKELKNFAKKSDLKNLFIKFIQLYRDSGLSEEELKLRADKSKAPYRSRLFLEVVFPLVQAIEETYKGAGCIEFSDMLSQGAKAARQSKNALPYKLILVDEFQDTSRLKIELVKAIADQHESDSVVFFVGDDWQAINRFAGSDIGIFKKYMDFDNAKIVEGRHQEDGFRSTHVVQLPETFRYPQGIAQVSREMILKNPDQINKPVEAKLLPETKDTIRIVEHFDSGEDRFNALLDELTRLSNLPVRLKKDGSTDLYSVYILTRNRSKKSPPEGLYDSDLSALPGMFKGKLNIQVKSMHKSKGLEADYTIIGGLDSGYKGFPSEMNSDPLYELVLPPSKSAVSEERRLFYVALTRSKIQTILLTVATRPSIFIEEFRQMKQFAQCFDWQAIEAKHDPCPLCRKGKIRQITKTLNGCTRYPDCGYKAEIVATPSSDD